MTTTQPLSRDRLSARLALVGADTFACRRRGICKRKHKGKLKAGALQERSSALCDLWRDQYRGHI